jgi:hypothetical protein
MIETVSDLQHFQLENSEGDLFLHAIPTDDNDHPNMCFPSLLFIRNLATGRTYGYSFEHPDSIPLLENGDITTVLEKMSNRMWALDKKAFSQIIGVKKINDVNLVSYLTDNTIMDASEYVTPAHFLVRSHSCGLPKVNLAIPLVKHLEAFNNLADDVKKVLHNYEPDIPFTRFNNLIIETLGDIESQGICVDIEKFKHHFEIDVEPCGIVHSQYNVYTSTGRPSNRYGGVNYAALNQTDGSRSCFKSRHGENGKLVAVDYTAFHPRIICALTKYPISVDVDIYEYLAQLYFQKKDVDETDIKNAKQLTFRQLYGGVEDKYAHIKYLANLKTYINEQWDFFQANGYIVTPFFKRKITTHHIQDPSPTKVFNYILQAVEGEISIPRVKDVQKYLAGKRTRAILYTYDAVLYDFHKEDGIQTLNDIRDIMSVNETFPMKTYMGDNYQDMRLISL